MQASTFIFQFEEVSVKTMTILAVLIEKSCDRF